MSIFLTLSDRILTNSNLRENYGFKKLFFTEIKWFTLYRYFTRSLLWICGNLSPSLLSYHCCGSSFSIETESVREERMSTIVELLNCPLLSELSIQRKKDILYYSNLTILMWELMIARRMTGMGLLKSLSPHSFYSRSCSVHLLLTLMFLTLLLHFLQAFFFLSLTETISFFYFCNFFCLFNGWLVDTPGSALHCTHLFLC